MRVVCRIIHITQLQGPNIPDQQNNEAKQLSRGHNGPSCEIVRGQTEGPDYFKGPQNNKRGLVCGQKIFEIVITLSKKELQDFSTFLNWFEQEI